MSDSATKERHDWACRMLDAAILTYNIQPASGSISTWIPDAATSGLLANLGLPDAPPDFFFDGSESINAGFVGRTSDGYAVLALRGTLPPGGSDTAAWVEDWVNDFKAGPVDWTIAGSKIGQIEAGFAEAALSLWQVGEGPLAKIVEDKADPVKGIVITGHSKGAALVYPVASLVETRWPGLISRIDAYATPMTADQAFADWFQSKGLTGKTTRYQNKDDIVPFLPVWPKLDISGWIMKVLDLSGSNLFSDDYVLIGSLEYLAEQGGACEILTGSAGQDQANTDIEAALESLDLEAIISAHSATGRYHTCLCGDRLPSA
ncbi:MAG: lipase family protein [Pseudomonadota bacterium]